MLEIFTYPFMVRALLAGVFVSVLLGWLGAFVTVRKMSLVGDGIAHASLAGIALAILLGFAPLPMAIIFSVFIAVFIYFLEKKVKISSDMAVALIFTTGMALGIILLNFYKGYQPELVSYLFGNILTINSSDLFNIIIVGSLILIFNFVFYNKTLFNTLDPVGAYMSIKKNWIYDLLLYIAISMSIVLSIKIVGIILVSALLVTPSAISKLFARSFKEFVLFAVLSSVLIVISGLFVSYYLDLPSGAVIVLVGTFLFMISYFVKSLKRIF